MREVQEETGVTIRLSVPLDSISYEAGNAGLKKVDYWGGVVLDSVRRAPDAEVDVVSWLPVRAALGRLTYSHDHFLVQQYLDQPATTPLIIVRHVKAMDRKDWSRKDATRPINTRGRRQAKILSPMLSAYGVTTLVSSTSTRCIATLMPYAHQHELDLDTYCQLSEEEGENDPKGVSKLIRKIRAATLTIGPADCSMRAPAGSAAHPGCPRHRAHHSGDWGVPGRAPHGGRHGSRPGAAAGPGLSSASYGANPRPIAQV